MIIYELADTGIFDILGSKKTRKQCAEEADLYEAFDYLASRKALERLNKED